MEFKDTMLGLLASFACGETTKVTNRQGTFVKCTSLDVRINSQASSSGDVVIEANFSTGTRAAGLALSLVDAERLRDLLTAALKRNGQHALLFCSSEWVKVPLEQALLDVRNNAAKEEIGNDVRLFTCQLCADGIEHPKESDMQKERELEERAK